MTFFILLFPSFSGLVVGAKKKVGLVKSGK